MNQFQQNVRSQLASLDARPADDPEDDDDMVLGDEAGAGFAATMSDDDGHASHSLNVSPTIDDDDEPPQLIDQKILGGPSAKPTHHISNDVHDRKTFSAISNDDYDDLYDDDNNNNNQSRGSNQRTPVSILFCFNILKLFSFISIRILQMINIMVYHLLNNDHHRQIHIMIIYQIQLLVQLYRNGYVIQWILNQIIVRQYLMTNHGQNLLVQQRSIVFIVIFKDIMV